MISAFNGRTTRLPITHSLSKHTHTRAHPHHFSPPPVATHLRSAHLELEKVPILPDEVPAQMFGQATVDIMTPNVQCISMKPTVGEVSLCLHSVRGPFFLIFFF